MRTELVGHEGDVNCIAFLPDGRSFISASNDGTMRVWDTFDSVSLVTRDRPEVLHRWVSTVKFSDGGHADSGRGNTLVRIFSEAVESSKIPTPEGHTEEVRSVIYSPDHPRIVADSVDGAVLLWLAMKFGPSLADFEHDTGTISALATSPDGTRFASAAQCGLQLRLRVWDALHSSKKPATLAPDYKMHALTMVDCLVMSLTFTADGDTLVLRTVSGELYAWKRNEKRQDVAGACSLLFWTCGARGLTSLQMKSGPKSRSRSKTCQCPLMMGRSSLAHILAGWSALWALANSPCSGCQLSAARKTRRCMTL
jgi:WD40 repeat protein